MRRPVRLGTLAAALLVVAAVVGGCGAGRVTTTHAAASSTSPGARPTLSEFAADPSCTFYNSATSIRLRLRATNSDLVCRFLARRFPVSRASWTTTPHDFRTSGGHRRYATVCRLARSEGKVWAEVEVNGPAGRFTPSDYLCANLAAKGWIDLGRRLTALDVLGLERTHDRELVLVYFCNTVSMSDCSPSATSGEERDARVRLQQEPCVRQVVFVPKALGQWWLQKEERIPPLHLGPNPLPDSLVVVAKGQSCASRIAAAARSGHLAGVEAVRVHS